MTKKAVLFDFDGVIGDSFGVNLEIIKRLEPDIDSGTLKRYFQYNINDAIKKYIKPEDFEKWSKDFFEQEVTLLREIKVFPQMVPVVKALANEYDLFIVSSKLSAHINVLLTDYGLAELFKNVYGSEAHFSKVEKFKMIFEKFGFKFGDCLFITDTLGDLREAASVGLPAFAVTWGYHDRGILTEGDYHEIIDDPSALADSVKLYFEKK